MRRRRAGSDLHTDSERFTVRQTYFPQTPGIWPEALKQKVRVSVPEFPDDDFIANDDDRGGARPNATVEVAYPSAQFAEQRPT